MYRSVVMLITLLSFYGCGQETLYSGLDEREANEMLAVLLSNDLNARKTGIGESLQIQTSRHDLPRAIALLSEQGYPREKFQSLGDVFKREGFVSSPMEERARLLYALSQELSQTISTIDGVVTARVHLAIPEQRVLSDAVKPSSASVFVKYRPDSTVAQQTASIKALIVNSIEGLPYDNVTVTFFPAGRAQRAGPAEHGPESQLAGLLPESRQFIPATAAFVVVSLLLILSRNLHRAYSKRSIDARPDTRS